MAKTDQELGGSLVARVEVRDGATWIALIGKVTEAANFTPLMKQRSPVHVHLSAVERINSLGVRGWVHFVRDCEAAGLAMTFDRVSPVMIQQVSMISNFFGARSQVRSLFVPYLCPKCNSEDTKLVEVTPGAPLPVALTVPCPKCGSPMQLEELEEMYASLFDKPT